MKISLIFVGISGNWRQLPEVTIFCTNFSKFARKWCKTSSILMNKFINSSKFGDELLFISNLVGHGVSDHESVVETAAVERAR